MHHFGNDDDESPGVSPQSHYSCDSTCGYIIEVCTVHATDSEYESKHTERIFGHEKVCTRGPDPRRVPSSLFDGKDFGWDLGLGPGLELGPGLGSEQRAVVQCFQFSA
ncbi:hypothetical protein EYF80_012716 [Liparis tanakae]|uniref:Uncharacterized protein n=1 Tax=Liparis tanakae TaxID=230148 RepID=A0A4Z2IGV0_9TELE|nr:hypothetical protein EYF80_012716 [Liparis tanakae]